MPRYSSILAALFALLVACPAFAAGDVSVAVLGLEPV